MTSADDREDARAGRDRTPDTTGSHRRSETAGFAIGHGPTHGSSAPLAPEQHDDTARDSLIGTDRGHRTANTSWGAIFAGTVTFLAILVVFALASAALGLSEASGIAVSIWGVVALVVALAVAGYIAGALAVRSGLLHGLVTWATSLVAMLVLVGWLGTSILGTIGGALGTLAQTAGSATTISADQASQAAQNADIDQQDVDQVQQQADQAAQDAQNQFEQNRDEIATGAWWAVGGLLLGALVTALGGAAGARSTHTTRADDYRSTRGR